MRGRRGSNVWDAHPIAHVKPNRAAPTVPRTDSAIIRPYVTLGTALGQLCRLVDPCETTRIWTTFLLFGVRVNMLNTQAELFDLYPTAKSLTFVVMDYCPTIGGHVFLLS